MGGSIITASLDVETSMAPSHYPWVDGSYLSKVGITTGMGHRSWTFTHDEASPIPHSVLAEEIEEYLTPVTRLVGHNIKFDLIWLQSLGVDTRHLKVYCTMVADYLLRGQMKDDLSLDACCKRAGLEMKDDRVRAFWDAGINTAQIPLRILDEYLEQDCSLPLDLFNHQYPQIIEQNMGPLFGVQMELIRSLVEMEYNGALTSIPTLDELIRAYKDKVVKIDTDLSKVLGSQINVNSGDELSAALFGGIVRRDGTEWVIRELKDSSKYYERKCINEVAIKGLGFRPGKGTELKKKGYYKTDREVMKSLRATTKPQRVVKKALLTRSKEYKTLTTLGGKTGTDGLRGKVQPDGCIHGQFNQTVTKTGRLSASNPNNQNYSRSKTAPIKTIFYPRYDWIHNGDIAQLEWRIAAALSGDKTMIQEIRDNVDYHADNAIQHFGALSTDKNFGEVRTDAKVLGFRMIYGGSPYAFYMDSKMPNFSLGKWQVVHTKFFEKYWRLRQWQEENEEIVNRTGQLISPSGRILLFKKYERTVRGETFLGYKPTQIANFPVQSFATADVMPLAMNEIARRKRAAGLRSKLILQVHDSLVSDAITDEMRELSHITVSVFEAIPELVYRTWGFEIPVPMTGDIEYGRTYGDMKKLPREKYM